MYVFIYFWLCWVFSVAWGLSLVAVGRGSSVVSVCGLLTVVASFCRAQTLGTRVSVAVALGLSCSVACGIFHVAHGLSCSAACGTFQDQGPNLCLLPWQADSLPLSCEGSPVKLLNVRKLGPGEVKEPSRGYMYRWVRPEPILRPVLSD